MTDDRDAQIQEATDQRFNTWLMDDFQRGRTAGERLQLGFTNSYVAADGTTKTYADLSAPPRDGVIYAVVSNRCGHCQDLAVLSGIPARTSPADAYATPPIDPAVLPRGIEPAYGMPIIYIDIATEEGYAFMEKNNMPVEATPTFFVKDPQQQWAQVGKGQVALDFIAPTRVQQLNEKYEALGKQVETEFTTREAAQGALKAGVAVVSENAATLAVANPGGSRTLV
jgi:hypothetical protein